MKRLKIVEQIIIVLIFAVLIPFSTIGIIISNISQHSIRSELSNTASLMAKALGDTIGHYIYYSQLQLNEYASAFNFIPDTVLRLKYIDEIEANTKIFKNLDIIESSQVPSKINDAEDGKMKLYSPIDEGKNFYLTAQIDLDIFDLMLGSENTKDRNIYVFESGTNRLLLTNAPKSSAIDALSGLKLQEGEKQAIFGHKKNTPKAYYKIDNPDWFIIVDTTKKITAQTITEARYKIILALIIAAISIIILVGLYTSYLYINIRQLFKGIQAVSQGNYDKKIHLIKRAFTPHEIVFLANEFNYMANKINISYNDLRQKNVELEKLNEFRENLVNATSHEFRTPLTSIIGYTSRLLRHDIKLDEKTKTESLKTIKQQAQRLSRMVEDLLVIPEIDSFCLKFNSPRAVVCTSLCSGLRLAQSFSQFC